MYFIKTAPAIMYFGWFVSIVLCSKVPILFILTACQEKLSIGLLLPDDVFELNVSDDYSITDRRMDPVLQIPAKPAPVFFVRLCRSLWKLNRVRRR